MKELRDITSVLIVTLLLDGCGIGGQWMNGNPFPTPPQPYLEYWVKEGFNPIARRQDSMGCGALDTRLQKNPDGYPVFTNEELEAAKRPGEELIIAEKRLRADWQRCMMNKDYTVSEEWMLLTDDY